MATSKLNYASIRSAQRKNKSMHEAKDLLPKHMQTNSSHYSNLSPPFPLDQPSKPFKDRIGKGKVGYSLFEEPQVGEKNSYAKSLFGRYKEEPVKHEEKITKGHYRVKSSITEMYQKSPEILEEDEITPGGATFGRFETNSNRGLRVNYDTLHVNENVGGMVARLEEDYRLARERGKENKIREDRVYAGLGQTKEGRMLSDFLKKDGGFGKETASPDDMRPRKKELSPSIDQGGDSIDKKNGIRLYGGRSPKNISIEDNLSPNGDFITKLDNYIDYFKKSERSHRRASKGGNEYFVEDRGKSHEEGLRDNEVKLVRKQMEGLSTKMHEVMKANKKILKEFSKMLMREDEYSQRLGGLEEEFASLKKKNKKYREKLKMTTHLLEKERTENENNMLALRKVLSKSEKQNDLESLIIKSGVNMVLENKIRKYVDDHREKQSKYEDMLRGGSADSGHKRREDKMDRHELKERKSSEKRQSVRKDDSLFAQKISLFSNDDAYLTRKTHRRDIEEDDDDDNEEEDDKLNTIEQEEDELYSTSPDKPENQYRKDNLWSPPRHKRGIDSSKEHQIRMLQERLSDLMEGRDYPTKYGSHEKQTNQVWPRNIDSGLLNNTKQPKPRNLSKHSIEVNNDTNQYVQNIRERQGSHPKMNSFHSRGESAFE